jgi:hypothetical protein
MRVVFELAKLTDQWAFIYAIVRIMDDVTMAGHNREVSD